MGESGSDSCAIRAYHPPQTVDAEPFLTVGSLDVSQSVDGERVLAVGSLGVSQSVDGERVLAVGSLREEKEAGANVAYAANRCQKIVGDGCSILQCKLLTV